MRFPIITLLSLLILLSALALSFHFLFSFGDADHDQYWSLMRQADPKQSSTESPYTAKQHHQQVCKEIWFLQDNQRLKLRIVSADTELVLDHHDDKTEVVELMRDVTCYMQEELYYLLPNGGEVIRQPDGQFVARNQTSKKAFADAVIDINVLKPMQAIRYLKADSAAYYYSKESCIVKDAQILRFIMPGHILVESLKGIHPLMSGVAKSAEFSLQGGDLHFTAHQFKAILHSKKDKTE